jgi:hypothetical protein
MNRRRCSKRQPRPISRRYGRVYLCSSLSGCSELRDGYREAMGVTFKLDTEDAQPIEIRGGQGILVRMEDGGLGVALVKAVRQVINSCFTALPHPQGVTPLSHMQMLHLHGKLL